ncbi:MAG: 50S ribosomal protein L33 [Deltaproteobacteria bacterium]|nr:50S ribosomal protein L33 [Deltaproteobacteria bacterium]
MGTRVKVVLVCKECDARNYEASRPSTPGTAPLSFRKHCATCNKHTEHHEAK